MLDPNQSKGQNPLSDSNRVFPVHTSTNFPSSLGPAFRFISSLQYKQINSKPPLSSSQGWCHQYVMSSIHTDCLILRFRGKILVLCRFKAEIPCWWLSLLIHPLYIPASSLSGSWRSASEYPSCLQVKGNLWRCWHLHSSLPFVHVEWIWDVFHSILKRPDFRESKKTWMVHNDQAWHRLSHS